MSSVFQHLKTICHHRKLVRKHCFRLGLYRQGLLHDLSKFSPTEFFPGVRYFQGTRSPNVAERNDIGYSTAWMHHKGRNRHHYEYWTDYPPTGGPLAPIEMPPRYLAEMFCDRVAASKTYKKELYTDASPLEYFLTTKEKQLMHPKTEETLLLLLTMLRDHGEANTFAYIRDNILKQTKNKPK